MTAQGKLPSVAQVEDRGTGPAVVLAHGTLMDRTMFAPQIEALADDFRVVAFDSRARTSAYDTPYGLDDLVADTVALLDRLEIERCVLGGMSMGGFMALEFALAHQDRLDGLVLIDVMAQAYTDEEQAAFTHEFERVNIDGPVPRDFAEWCAPLCFGPTTVAQNPDLVQHWVDRWTGLPARSVFFEAHSWLGKPDLSEWLAEIEVPTLVVHGEEDVVLTLDRARPMLDVLPRGRLEVVPEAGHTSNLEQPERVNGALQAFLRGVYPR